MESVKRVLSSRLMLMLLSSLATTASVTLAVEYPALHAAICAGG